MMEHCHICHALVPLSEKTGLPVSKYWRSRFSANMRIKEEDIVEVYCGADHSLQRYEERGRK